MKFLDDREIGQCLLYICPGRGSGIPTGGDVCDMAPIVRPRGVQNEEGVDPLARRVCHVSLHGPKDGQP